MAYATYTTDAIVCGSASRREADRSYLLFTESAGMLFATARSVREERSRQRCALQECSRIRVSLVRGKQDWRIGSVEAFHNPFLETPERAGRGLAVRVIKLLRRYVHGESALPAVFADTSEIMRLIDEVPSELYDTVFAVFHLRLLSTLGYIAPIPELGNLLEAPTIAEAGASCTQEQHQAIERVIATASAASHL